MEEKKDYEVNGVIMEKLKSACKFVDINTLARVGESIEVAIDKLVEAGNRGELIYTEFNGKALYSFYSADALYQQVFGKTKGEFSESEKKQEKFREEKKLEDKQLREKAIQEKLPKWEQVIRESFPSDIANEKMKDIKERLDLSADYVKDFDNLVALLETLKTKSESEVKEAYLGSYNLPGSRLFNYECLKHSYFADKMEPLLRGDIEQHYKDEPDIREKKLVELEDYVLMAMNKKAEKDGSNTEKIMKGLEFALKNLSPKELEALVKKLKSDKEGPSGSTPPQPGE